MDSSSLCSVCRALLDEEDLFCPNCGREAPSRGTTEAPKHYTATRNFQCGGCGASMSYDASAGTLKCPFCGSGDLDRRDDAPALSPSGVVPFAVLRENAVAAMRQWLSKGFWRPGDLAQQATIVNMLAVYVPYWVFQATTHTYWTADTDQTPPGAAGDWFPLFGEHRGSYSGLLVGASGALSAAETAALQPFDLRAAVPPSNVDLENVIVEQFSVPRKYARPLAQSGIASLEAQACDVDYVPGQCRNMKVNPKIEGLSSQPMLLPVWIMAYRYDEQVYRFLVNGQNGQCTGKAPISWRKIVAAVAIGAAIVLVPLVIALAAGR
jgi:hypothetical protein